jgi:acetyl esterase/lipase
LPDALVIVDENDVLRDEGEACARKLAQAGVRVTAVRYNGTIHDFVLLKPARRHAGRARRDRAGKSCAEESPGMKRCRFPACRLQGARGLRSAPLDGDSR